MDSGVIISIVISIAAIVIACLFGFVPRVKKQEIDELNIEVEKLKKRLISRTNELIIVYKDVKTFRQIIEIQSKELDISVRKAQKDFTINGKYGRKTIEKRICELEDQFKQV
jgi:hypothetical protein